MGLVQDIRFALRVFLRKPLFTLVVVVTLALGIGANSAMFSMIHELLYDPVSYPERDRLVAIQERRKGGNDFGEVAPRSFLDWQTEARSFTDVAAVQFWEVALTGHGDPEQVIGVQVSPRFFEMFGVRPALGRFFAPDEVDDQNEQVVILSHALWQRRYGGDRELVGQKVELDGASYTVVGVMPPDFRYPSFTELWAPLTLDPAQRADRRSHYLNVVAHLRPGVSAEEAHAEMLAIGARHGQAYAETNSGRETRVIGFVHSLTEDFTRDFIWILGGAALFVLLITCANVANVFLAHALARRREIAVRAALGAGRARVVRQLLTESSLLGIAGGVLSLLVAEWVVDLVKAAIPPTTTRFIAGWEAMGVDPVVLGFALAVGVLVGLVFGVAPALQVARIDVGAALKDGDRGASAGPRTQRLRSTLVVAQVALALMLLVTAGAMVRGFHLLSDNAFDPDGVLALRVMLPAGERYAADDAVLAFQERVVERMTALPGAAGAATVSNVPWGRQNWSTRFVVEGREVDGALAPSTNVRVASVGYLELLRVRKLAGRLLESTDGAKAPRVAVVNDAFADRHWPGESALGKRIFFSGHDDGEWTTIVGVVGTVEEYVDDRASRPVAYVPASQGPARQVYFVVRTAGDPGALARPAREAVWAIDPAQPIASVSTLRATRDEQLSPLRTGSAMMGGFAGMAALLAVLGLYGVIATLVTQRTHEIGVRVALGARRGDIVRLVLRRGLRLTAIGVGLGLAGGIGLVSVLESIMKRIVHGEVVIYVATAVLVGGAALLGSYVPARRAARVDPMIALRND